MDAIKPINSQALILLKSHRAQLSAQQYKTLRGQVLAGNAEGATRGLQKILKQKKEQANDHKTRQGAGHSPRE